MLGVASAPMTSAEFKVGRASPRGEERELGGGGGGAHSHLTSVQFELHKLPALPLSAYGAPCRAVEALISTVLWGDNLQFQVSRTTVSLNAFLSQNRA